MKNSQNFWPDGIEGAVSLTFDDGVESHLDNAIPCLDEYGLKGTFYLNPGRSKNWEENIDCWQKASRTGHEMGNHTTRHPCSCNFGFSADYCLEKMTLADIEETIDQATELMDGLFPEQGGRRSFCYPCYQTYVGQGIHRLSYVPLVAKRFRAARGRGERPNDPHVIDLAYTWSWPVEGNSGEELIAYVEDATAKGMWGVICMHGIGGGITFPYRPRLCRKSPGTWIGTVIEFGPTH